MGILEFRGQCRDTGKAKGVKKRNVQCLLA